MKENKNLAILSIAAVLLVIGLWLFAYFSLRGREATDRGTFGDMFGAVNALFSGLAFAGIIITIFLQSNELSLQRQELKETREELAQASKAQSRQAKNLEVSAKLTALNTLVTFYTNEIDASKKDGTYNKPMNERNITQDPLELKRYEFIIKIREILAETDERFDNWWY